MSNAPSVWPALCTLAWAVPKEMVDTGTLACLAAAMASASGRPVLLAPSERRTIWAAGVFFGALLGGGAAEADCGSAASEVKLRHTVEAIITGVHVELRGPLTDW